MARTVLAICKSVFLWHGQRLGPGSPRPISPPPSGLHTNVCHKFRLGTDTNIASSFRPTLSHQFLCDSIRFSSMFSLHYAPPTIATISIIIIVKRHIIVFLPHIMAQLFLNSFVYFRQLIVIRELCQKYINLYEYMGRLGADLFSFSQRKRKCFFVMGCENYQCSE